MLNKVAVITGGSSGIGAEFARQLANKGYNLLLVSNQQDQLINTKDEIEEKFHRCNCNILYQDLSEPDAATNVFRYCQENELEVEILINNSGIFTFKELLELSTDKINLYIDLHMRAVTLLCHIFGRDMQKRHHGYILNMSSMSCWMPMPGIAMYTATKAYIRVMSRSLYLELKEAGVHVMVACPGGIATGLFGLSPKLQHIGVMVGALSTPQTFVRGTLRRLFNKKKQYINGLINRFAIFVVAILPTSARLTIKHKLLDPKHENVN